MCIIHIFLRPSCVSVCIQEYGESQDGSSAHHKLNGVEEALVELAVLELVLWVVGTVHHPARAAGRRSKLLLAGILHTGNTFFQTLVEKVNVAVRLVPTSTYDDELVIVLSVLPSTNKSLLGSGRRLR